MNDARTVEPDVVECGYCGALVEVGFAAQHYGLCISCYETQKGDARENRDRDAGRDW